VAEQLNPAIVAGRGRHESKNFRLFPSLLALEKCQGVLDRKILVNPVRGLVRRLKPIEVRNQVVTRRR
jgi:hypothetical protein